MKNDGGPAFPSEYYGIRGDDTYAIHTTSGMSLRDWFAGQEESQPPNFSLTWGAAYLGISEAEYAQDWTGNWSLTLAKWRYQMADAMLNEREKE